MRLFTISLLLIISFLLSGFLQAQHDIVSWTSMEAKLKFPDNAGFNFKPTIRHNNNLSNYTDASIDISFYKKMKGDWQFQFLNRYWWIQEGPDRNFWFIDIAHQFKLNTSLSIRNVLRWHIAQDIHSRDPNFMRYQPRLSYNSFKNLKLFIEMQYFYRLDGINDMQRLRYVGGFSWNVNGPWGFNFQYWLQKRVNNPEQLKEHILVTTLFYEL